MAFGPDGYLYVSNIGYGMESTGGHGEIVQVDVGLRRSCRPVNAGRGA